MIRIALIPPVGFDDYLCRTLADGLGALARLHPQEIEWAVPAYAPQDVCGSTVLKKEAFVAFAQKADLILLCRDKNGTNIRLAEEIGAWQKTAFIDGSELRKNRRFDPAINASIEAGTYADWGNIDAEMLARAALYFRREKPYKDGILPLPFGIEERYQRYRPGMKKDIDFVCIFGQDEYPPLRREVREALERYCAKEGFSCKTKQTALPFVSIYSRFAQNRFYSLLARAKVGISVGGGGFDTLRFWEILGNNCLLMTETIDVFRPEDRAFPYSRVSEFSDIASFEKTLSDVGAMLRTEYPPENLDEEYAAIMRDHSTAARVKAVLRAAREKGILTGDSLSLLS